MSENIEAIFRFEGVERREGGGAASPGFMGCC